MACPITLGGHNYIVRRSDSLIVNRNQPLHSVSAIGSSTRGSAVAEKLRDALWVEILSTATQRYEKSHFKRLAIAK